MYRILEIIFFFLYFFFFFQAEDGIRDWSVTGVQTCALPICVTTMFGGGTGPATGTNATTCTPGAWHIARMYQALGSLPEPVSPAPALDRFATRLSLPDPIGLEEDVMAAIDRMLPRLCGSLRNKGRGARTLRFEAYRSDGTMQWMNVTLAKPSDDSDRIRPLLRMKVEDLDAGYGIDMLRLEAVVHEPIHLRTKVGHLEAGAAVKARRVVRKRRTLAGLSWPAW